MAKSRGMSYRKRVEDINRIYDRHARSGLSNREIWRRYNIMNATAGLEPPVVASDMPSLFDFMGDNHENQESDERP